MSNRDEFVVLTADMLANVAGGADDPGYQPDNDGLGRAGPGLSWPWLGYHYTPEALAHDKAVRGNLAAGDGQFMAHVKALPKLPAAVWSWGRSIVHPGPQDRVIPPRH